MSATRATELVLGGKPRTLRYTNRALVAIEDKTGLGLGELAIRLTAGSIRTTATLVWAGLLHEDPRVTIDQVIDMLDLQRLEDVARAIEQGLKTALGTGDAEPGNPPAADSAA